MRAASRALQSAISAAEPPAPSGAVIVASRGSGALAASRLVCKHEAKSGHLRSACEIAAPPLPQPPDGRPLGGCFSPGAATRPADTGRALFRVSGRRCPAPAMPRTQPPPSARSAVADWTNRRSVRADLRRPVHRRPSASAGPCINGIEAQAFGRRRRRRRGPPPRPRTDQSQSTARAILRPVVV